MTPADAGRFAAAMTAAAETLGEPMSPVRIEGYFTALRDCPLEAVERALGRAIREWRSGGGRPNFPRPGDLRDLVSGTPEDRAVIAWGRVVDALERHGTYQSLDFRDRVLHATVTALGGWGQAWRWERMTPDELGYVRHQFCALYTAYLRQPPADPPRYLVGAAEAENRLHRGAFSRGLGHVDDVLQLGPGGEVVSRRAITSSAPAALPPAESRERP